jgi:hypothetical protein
MFLGAACPHRTSLHIAAIDSLSGILRLQTRNVSLDEQFLYLDGSSRETSARAGCLASRRQLTELLPMFSDSGPLNAFKSGLESDHSAVFSSSVPL